MTAATTHREQRLQESIRRLREAVPQIAVQTKTLRQQRRRVRDGRRQTRVRRRRARPPVGRLRLCGQRLRRRRQPQRGAPLVRALQRRTMNCSTLHDANDDVRQGARRRAASTSARDRQTCDRQTSAQFRTAAAPRLPPPTSCAPRRRSARRDAPVWPRTLRQTATM